MGSCSSKFECAFDYFINGDDNVVDLDERERLTEDLQNGWLESQPYNDVIDHGLILLDVTVQNLASAYKRYGVTSVGIIVFESRLSSELEFGDKIISVNGRILLSSSDFDAVIRECSVGDVVVIRVEREGRTIDVELTLREKVPDEVSFY